MFRFIYFDVSGDWEETTGNINLHLINFTLRFTGKDFDTFERIEIYKDGEMVDMTPPSQIGNVFCLEYLLIYWILL